MTIPAGHEATIGDFIVVNGQSGNLFNVICSDTSPAYANGYVLRR